MYRLIFQWKFNNRAADFAVLGVHDESSSLSHAPTVRTTCVYVTVS